VTTNAFEAAEAADAIVTDCWVSMGDEDEGRRHNLLMPYQVNAKLMGVAAKDAVFMHCLPAHRGEEVTTRSWTGRNRWCSTRPRTGSTPRRASWPGASGRRRA
jgi:ornithine carbamoyltransferase